MEESIHLVTKPRRQAKQDKEKLSLVTAHNASQQSMMHFAQINHFQPDAKEGTAADDDDDCHKGRTDTTLNNRVTTTV